MDYMDELQHYIDDFFQDNYEEVEDDDEDDVFRQEYEVSNEFVARSYQEELFEHAKEKNSILVLGTGSGKTFISIMLIRELADCIRGRLEEGAKRTVFIVNTVPLVYQQTETIRKHTGLTVGCYEGSMGVDIWSEEKWKEELNRNEVLVMVAQIFKDVILHDQLPLGKVNLIIMDECHHATGSHPMREIMREYNKLKKEGMEIPRVMGLTACIIHKKCKDSEVRKLMKNLEEVMDSVLVTSQDQREVLKFTTKPTDLIISCPVKPKAPAFQEAERKLCTIQENIKSFIDSFLIETNESKSKMMKYVHKQIKAIIDVSNDLGEYVLPKAILLQSEYLLVAETDSVFEREILKKLGDELKQFHDQEDFSMFNDPKRYISGKVERLLELLGQPSEEERTVLVFVTRRNTCKLLCSLLHEFKDYDTELHYLRPDFVVGGTTNAKGDIKINEEVVKQKITLENFRKGTCNLIVSTSVLEEGIDVRKCNLVIRYNASSNYRSFIQSLGRARAIPSYFVTFTYSGKDEEEAKTNIECFKKMREELNSLCHGRELPDIKASSEGFREDELEPPFAPYGIPGPQITFSSAIQLVNRYCGTLPQDKFTKLSVTVKKRRYKDKFYVELTLPMSCPLKTKIISKYMNNWDEAKKSAALEACKQLFELGLLSRSLLPKKSKDTAKESFNKYVQIIEEVVPQSEPQPGTKKRRQIYGRKICMAFTQRPQEYHLYSVCFQHIESLDEKLILDSAFSKTNLGLICGGKLNCCSFPLYSKKWGEVNIILEYKKSIECSSEVLKIAKKFHQVLLNYVFKLNLKVMNFNPEIAGHSVFIVPLNKSLKLDVLEMINLDRFESNLNMTVDQNHVNKNFQFDRERYEGAVIIPVYRKMEIYRVLDILRENPLSPFPDSKRKYSSYKEYFESEYNVNITNNSQSLIECKHFSKEFNYLSKVEMKGRNSDSIHPKFIPELCAVLPFTVSFFCQALCIPSILHQINGLQIEQELYESIGWLAVPEKEAKFRNSCINYKWSDNEVSRTLINKKDNLAVKLCRKREMNIHAGMILQALTPLYANKEFNLERLEVIGDSYLKYSIGVYLFCKEDVSHEGMLTMQRSNIVSNRTLYSLARRKELISCIQGVALSPTNAIPYGFYVYKDVEKTMKQSKVAPQDWHQYPKHESGEFEDSYNPWREQHVADKTVADSVESLIGVYLLNGGELAANHFLHWLGLSFVKEKVQLPSTAVVGNIEKYVYKNMMGLYKKYCLDRLECIIGYTFQEKSFIVQAVTHPSYVNNKVTDSYQRLEFLGDSILDYLVTGYIYSNFKDYSPGQLTDLRSHYVRNDTLAKIAIKFELNKFLMHQSCKLNSTINGFIELLEREETEFNMEYDTVEPEDIEVPKALGDMVESLIGAIYIDSNKNLEVTWRLVENFMREEFDRTKESIPIDCVRELYEKCNNVQFVFVPTTEDEPLTTCTVKVEGYSTVSARGKNKRTAKQAAARRALKMMNANN